MVNIRDQCSWVHTGEPGAATDKAKDLVRMGVARARHLEPLERRSIPINRDVLVIGGGAAGMCAALEMDAQGLRVFLVERSDKLGGRLDRLTEVYPAGLKASSIADDLITKVRSSRVQVQTGAEVESITGFIGNFEVVTTKGQLRVGTIVIATGSDLYAPGDDFGYSEFSNVMTNQELEDLLAVGDSPLRVDGQQTSTVVFVQCVGSRDPDNNPACSRYCCPTTIKQALKLRESGVNVVVLHRDMRTVGARAEELYREARSRGVKFLRYTPERLPVVKGRDGRANHIELLELALNRTLTIPADAVVLAAGMVPQADSTEKLQQLLKVPRAQDGFFMERHAKLGPVETNIEGVFLAGCASGPRDIADSLAQGAAAAAKAAAISCRDTVALEPVTCTVDPVVCRACGTCVEICQYHAPELVEAAPGMQVADINQALCKGCGTCASWCPTGAIAAQHFTDKQINSMLEALLVAEP
jgi:heterodisulfide reductase subunit A